MTTSGTISETTFNNRQIIDRAFGRCKVKPQDITGEMIERANENLYLILSSLPNEGTPLWCVQKVLIPLTAGQAQLITPVGTIDLINAFYRMIQPVTGTEVDDPAGLSTTLDSPATVATVGLQWGGNSVPVAVQASDDGIAWTTLATDAQEAVDGQWTWIDVDGATAKSYWRVIPTTGTLDLDDWTFGSSPTDLQMSRLNRDQYQQLPNKSFTGRPLQYWFDRQFNRPVMHLWPVPDATAATNLIVAYRHRHVMDVGSMTQSIEVPQRWLNAIISRLAMNLALDTPEVNPQLIPMLTGLSKMHSDQAWMEERDRSPIYYQPNIGVYTR